MHPPKKLIPYGIAIALAALGADAFALPAATVEMFKNPYCGCCEHWAEHMRANGYVVNVRVVPDVTPVRRGLGVADAFVSCHTATVGGYVVEGHVPAGDVGRLLKEHPRALGLASPGMPQGAPGMDGPGKAPYDVLLVQRDGRSRVFAAH